MDTGQSEVYINEGDEIYGSDGDKVGTVIAIQDNYVVVEKGWFFPTDYYIPVSAIASYEDGRAYLNVTKDVALEQGWDAAPTMTDTTYATNTYETSTDTLATRDTGYAASDVTVDNTAGTMDTGVTSTMSTEDTLRVPVYEEELTATKTAHEVGGARIEKDVVTEEQVLDVPVTEERLKVVRRAVDRPVTAADTDAFEEVIVDVPLRVEDVELEKRVRVAEEVELQKEEVQRTERVAGTVRREEVRVTEDMDDTVVDTDSNTRL